jgi:nitrogen fixation protein FixH
MPTTLPVRNPASDETGFRLNGRMVLVIFCSFFGIIFAVNAVFMHFAFSTFGGIDKAGAYRANFLMTREIAAAEKQDKLGWTVNGSIKRTGASQARIEIAAKDRNGHYVDIKSIEAELRRPADQRQDGAVHLKPVGMGRYAGEATHVGPGNWLFVVTIHDANNNRFRSRNRLLLK